MKIQLPLFLLTVLFFAVLAPANKGCIAGRSIYGKKNSGPLKENPVFYGRIVYLTTATGTNQEGIDLFKAGAPSKVEIMNAPGKFRLIETGGFFEGNICADLEKKECWWLYPKEKTFEKSTYMDMDAVEPEVKAMMPQYFSPPKLESTNESDTIMGKVCKKYKIVESSMLRPGATGFIWIFEEMDYPKSRFDFQTESKRVTSPLPLSMNMEKGIVMKIEVNEDETIGTFLVTEWEEKKIAASEFHVPSGWKLK